MVLRPLKPSDTADTQELLKQLGFNGTALEMRDRIDRVLAEKYCFAVVAEDAGEIVGLVHAFARPALEKPYEVVVQSLVVRKETQHRGIGQLLMHAVENWASARGFGSVALHTRNAGSFYEKLGYQMVATPHFMRKHLERN
jgi:N-acetylglutamate synthase-like GNAT family acetyltransferase